MSEEGKFDEARGPEPGSRSPQPTASTSAAAAARAAMSTEPAPRRLSLYTNIAHLQSAGRLRGLRTARRRLRFQNRRNANMAKNEEAMSILDPLYYNKKARLEAAQAMVAEIIEDFAVIVERILKQLEAVRRSQLEGDDGGERKDQRWLRERLAEVHAGAWAEARTLRRRLERALKLVAKARARLATVSKYRPRHRAAFLYSSSDSDSE